MKEKSNLASTQLSQSQNTTQSTTSSQTPIEIALQIDENGMTSLKNLYEFLELNLSSYSKWCKRNILENPFATENIDYITIRTESENHMGRPTYEYKLTSDFAKQLSMTVKNERGQQARQYFIACEQGLKVATQKLNSQSNKSTEINEKIVDLLSSMNDRLDKLEEKQDTKKLPNNQYSRWKSRTFEKLNMLVSFANENSNENLSLSDIMHIVENEFQDTYNIDLKEYADMYKCEYGIDQKPYPLDVINHYKDIRNMYDKTLDNIMKRIHIDEIISKAPKNIFDVLAAQIDNCTGDTTDNISVQETPTYIIP